MRISLRELMLVVAVAAVGMAGLKFASTEMRTVVQAMTGLILLAMLVKATVDRGARQAFAVGFAVCALIYLLVLSVSLNTSVLNRSIGTFGTGSALDGLHKLFVTQYWIDQETGREAMNFQVMYPAEQEYGQASRLVLLPWTPGSGTAEVGDDTGADDTGNLAIADDSPVGTRFGRGGRGRRGRGVSSDVAAVLTPQQTDEYSRLTRVRQDEIRQMIEYDRQAVNAIRTGRPLSTITYVNYRRVNNPPLSDFRNVGYCLWVLLIGYFGGHFAGFIYRRRDIGG